jgi:signal transduction histidine kinase
MAALAGLSILSTYVANFIFFRKFFQRGLDLKLSSDHAFFQFLQEQQDVMNRILAVDSMLMFSIIVTLGLVFSHRIAGPLYKLHKHLLETSHKNKYSDVHFRKNDFFSEIADAYNQQLPGKKELRDKSHEQKEKKSA